MAESLGFTYKLGEPTVVPDHTENPVYACFPDAHITVGPHPEQTGRYDSIPPCKVMAEARLRSVLEHASLPMQHFLT